MALNEKSSRVEVETYTSGKIAREIKAKGAPAKPCKCIEGVNAGLEKKNEVLTLAIPTSGKVPTRCVVAKHALEEQRERVVTLLVANYCPFCGLCYGEDGS